MTGSVAYGQTVADRAASRHDRDLGVSGYLKCNRANGKGSWEDEQEEANLEGGF